MPSRWIERDDRDGDSGIIGRRSHHSSDDEPAPRTSLDSLAETTGTDLVVSILRHERERQMTKHSKEMQQAHSSTLQAVETPIKPRKTPTAIDGSHFLAHFAADKNVAAARQTRLQHEAGALHTLRKPLNWKLAKVTVGTDGILDDFFGHALYEFSEGERRMRTMVLFLHEPQLPGGTDKFLLLEPFGVAGHNQLMPEIGRAKQFRIYDRDITRFAQTDEHTVKLSLVGNRVSSLAGVRLRRPPCMSYLFLFQTPTDCLSFMISFRSDAKTVFKTQTSITSRTYTFSRAGSLLYTPPSREASKTLAGTVEGDAAAVGTTVNQICPALLDTPKGLEEYFVAHFQSNGAAAQKAYSNYDLDKPLWENAALLRNADRAQPLDNVPHAKPKLTTVTSNPTQILCDNRPMNVFPERARTEAEARETLESSEENDSDGASDSALTHDDLEDIENDNALQDMQQNMQGRLYAALTEEWADMGRMPYWYLFTHKYLMAPLGSEQGLPPPSHVSTHHVALIKERDIFKGMMYDRMLERDKALVCETFAARSLLYFGIHHPVRAWCIRLVRSRLWAGLVPFIIFGNIILLAALNPLEGVALQDETSSVEVLSSDLFVCIQLVK